MSYIAESHRIYLAKFSELDVEGFFQLNADPEVIRYTGDAPFKNKKQVVELIEAYDHYQKYGFGRWSVYSKKTNDYLGFCGLRFSDDSQEVDIGFRLQRRFWGQGFATEAARLSLEIGFNQYHLSSIVGRAMRVNQNSHRLLEKIGFTFEKNFTQLGKPWGQYRLTRRQFAEKNVQLKTDLQR
ncbi:GNAT family N-acetyltransferase [Aliikangiella coralliicola]|uniref:GNAT family N-acetyltransferase n=1 Tax=Aliikangiella coralliicola TaxID=2592383 RepID=A0A545U762_9GAMM|nr:GNAT family N-acetyltransferase [Aliikangiella coralliicola]TQV85290.1 GNAT family N-acetyltransferase [Aliikangiella coralliicola]